MPLRRRLLAPLAVALSGVVISGLLTLAPAAGADPVAVPTSATRTKGDQTRTIFPRSSYLCYGYTNCKAAGYGNAGYALVNKKMYWRMYSGHNCTNYAAYRMVKSGLPNTRPWSGGGNATYWGTSVPGKTNGTPTVGAVAWWKANVGPAGSAGHVAYVEQVVSADEIIISQDSWGGDFSWAVVTRASGNWPSGFIHFNDVTMVNKAAPSISGTAKVGSRLTASPGKWKPTDADVSYQWYADGSALKGATKASLALGKKRVGQTITVKATATKLGYPTLSATSAATSAVLPGQLTTTVSPTISGEAKVDATLTLDGGTWNPTPSGLAYAWFADGQPIPGAEGTSLTLTPDLVGTTITASVTATRDGYDPVTVYADATAPVAPGVFSITRGPSVSGAAKVGETLYADPGLYQPTDGQATYQWLRDGEPVLNATGPTYAVTAADLGSRLSVEVTVARAGYESLTSASPTSARVKATPKIGLTRLKLKHRIKLTIVVTAPDVAPVEGTVVVRVQGGFRQEVTLVNGKAKVNVRDLPKGKRNLRITYTGSRVTERVVKTGSLRMP